MAAESTDCLFAYGTLMFPEIWDSVVGRDVTVRQARLRGHRALCVIGYDFPGLVPADPSEIVPGLLYEGLSGDEFGALDDYEASMYDRVIVEVELGGEDSPRTAFTYRVKEARRSELSDEIWSPSRARRD